MTMMLSSEMQAALNEQIGHEMYASHLYLAMAAYFESVDFPGFAHWMRGQAEEEREHALKIYDYVHDRGGRVTLGVVDQPPADFGSPLAAFEGVLAHELQVTGQIEGLYEMAGGGNDYATQVMVQWFIEEQVEEERSAREVVARLQRVGDQPAALLMVDRQLGERE